MTKFHSNSLNMKNYLLLFVLLLPLCTWGQPGTIHTIAGCSTSGFPLTGVPVDSAHIVPYGVAVDKHGIVYITDVYNNVVYKFREGDTIRLVGGTNYPGFSGDGGPALAAYLQVPMGITFDTAGNLVFADNGNSRVRQINLHDTINTIAGNGGPAVAARVSSVSIAYDSHNNLLIADGNSRIRKVNAAGIIETIAGSGVTGYSGNGVPATSAVFDGINSVCADANGNIYLSDGNNNLIRKIDLSGIVHNYAGIPGVSGFSGDGGLATSATLNSPTDVKADSFGNVYVVDNGNNRIRKISPSGIITTIAGNGTVGFSGDGGPATAARLASPATMWLDDSNNIFIADNGNHRIRKIGHEPVTTTTSTITTTTTTITTTGGTIVTGGTVISDSTLTTTSTTQFQSAPAALTQVKIYPNPSDGNFMIEVPGTAPDATLDIYSINGGKLYSRTLNTNQTLINMQQPPGIYFVRLYNADCNFSKTLIIESPKR